MEKPMPLKTFFLKRYLYALGFVFPVVLGCALIAFAMKLLERYTNLEQESIDFMAIVAAWALFILSGYLMLTKKTFRGILGFWQRFYRGIPTWSERMAEQNKKPEA